MDALGSNLPCTSVDSPVPVPRSARVLRRGAREVALRRLGEEIADCRRCPRLVDWREEVARTKRAAYRDEDYWGRPVPGVGDPKARVLVVGLAPAAHGANRTGRMFTGDRSGDWLFRALHRAGFASQSHSVSLDDGMVLRDVYITAPVRCAPPANAPTPDERAACLPFLEREMELLSDVRVVVVLGQIGYDSMCRVLGIRPRPKFGHGVVVQAPNGWAVVCSFHVSQQNTFTGRLTEPMLDAVFTTARELAGLAPHPGPTTR
jgi:uracil-DNA glycosylase family 4